MALLNIKTPMQLQRESFMMMLYGKAGVGKTTFASQAQDVPEMKDIIFFDFDQGCLSISDRDDISVFAFQGHEPSIVYPQFYKALLALNKHAKVRDDDKGLLDWHKKNIDPNFSGELKRYQTIVIDSITVLFDLAYALAFQKITKEKPEKFYTDVPPLTGYDNRQVYGKSADMIMRLINLLFRMPFHVIIIGHEKFTVDEETNRKDTFISLPSNLRVSLQIYFDVILHLTSGRKGRTFTAESSGGTRAKTRIINPFGNNASKLTVASPRDFTPHHLIQAKQKMLGK